MQRAQQRPHGMLLCLLVCAVLNGCARPTEAQQTVSRTGAAIKEARSEVHACIAANREQPKYTEILSHYPDLESHQYTIEQLSDKNVPTTQEARLVASLYDGSEKCRALWTKVIAENRPDVIPIVDESNNALARITMNLVQRKISWGEAAQQSQAVSAEIDEKIATANRQWGSDLQASNNEEIAQRRAAAGIALQYMQNQQMIRQ